MQEKTDIQTIQNKEEAIYTPPAIIYESVISTRAGSPITSGSPVPPADRDAINLFPED